MLSKKHYTKIAESFSNAVNRTIEKHKDGKINGNELSEVMLALNYCANDLCVTFKADNPNFDRSKFLKACFDK